MNISKHAWDGTPNYPVEVKKTEDGRFRVTTTALQGKEWLGESVEAAMKTFNEDMDREYDRLMFESEPGWMKDAKDGKWL